MDRAGEYGLKCLITIENDVQMLHIEVRCKIFPAQCYFKHLTFNQLSPSLQSLFNNVSHLYVYMNQPGMVYFDDMDAVLKICIPIAGRIREFPVELESKGREEGLKHRIMLMQQEKARLEDQFSKLKQIKQEELQDIKRKVAKQIQERQQLQKKAEQLKQNLKQAGNQISILRLQSQCKMAILKKMNLGIQINQKLMEPKESKQLKQYVKQESNQKFCKFQQTKSTNSHNETDQIKGELNKMKNQQNIQLVKNPQLQGRKQFWIKQVSSLKKPKTLALKKLISPSTNFQEQRVLSINGIQLKKMLFVEIFINLQIINLSNNHIRNIEGLMNLKRLSKLDLSQNMVDMIKGLTNNHRLTQIILHTNKIKVLQNIFHLSQIRIIQLSKNEIEVIPDQISKLYKLEQLRVANNNIKTISQRVQLLKHLKIFTIVGNKCYSERNKSKQIIDRLINKGVKTTSPVYM